MGISSYYHLLIDHIIPVWITKNIIEKHLNLNSQHKSFFMRISNNKYKKELLNANDIFKYFLNDNYVETISGRFKYIIYGYAYTYRPYHGPVKIDYLNNYQIMLDKFLNTCLYKNISDDIKYIIIPKRQTRNNNIINLIFLKLNTLFNIKYIDFSTYSIDEQIKLCSNAFAMIGLEGAAFANQIFMPKQSCVICICDENNLDHIPFQLKLSKYLNHDFNTITFNNNFYSIDDINNNIINIINKL